MKILSVTGLMNIFSSYLTFNMTFVRFSEIADILGANLVVLWDDPVYALHN